MAFWVPFLIALTLNVASFLLTPNPKQEKPPEVQDLESPTAAAGVPMAVVFGSPRLKSPNNLFYTDKRLREYEVSI